MSIYNQSRKLYQLMGVYWTAITNNFIFFLDLIWRENRFQREIMDFDLVTTNSNKTARKKKKKKKKGEKPG